MKINQVSSILKFIYHVIPTRLLIGVLLINVLAFCAPTSNVSAQTPISNPYFQVVPNKENVAQGEEFYVDVQVFIPTEATANPDINIAGYQFNFNYNANIIEVKSLTEGILLKQNAASTYFKPGIINNIIGTVSSIACVITTPGKSVNTTANAVRINCKVKNEATVGSSSGFSLSNVLIGNKDAISVNLGTPIITQVIVQNTNAIYDINEDGIIDINDVIIDIQALGLTGSNGWRKEDVDKNGVINIIDVILIVIHIDD